MIHKKKIAFVGKDMCIGGVEKALVELSRVLDYSHYDVYLYLLDIKGELLFELDSRIQIRSFPSFSIKKLMVTQFKKLQFINLISYLYNRLLARIHVKDWRKNAWYAAKGSPPEHELFDCVISYQGAAPAVSSASLYRLRSKKRILWIHGHHNHPESMWSFFDNNYNRFDLLFGVSQATCEEFSVQFPKSSKKAQVLYNILDCKNILQKSLEPINISMESPALVTVGRLAAEKGQDIIPKTVRILLDAGYNIHWYLIGEGSLRPKIEDEIRKYKVEDYVLLLGAKKNPYPYIKNCDIYVQPSFTEGYCTTTIEAKVLMKPVVTTNAPGMQEQFISGENGLIVASMTPEALSQGIQTLIDHPEQKERFIRALQSQSYDNTAELQKLYDFI